jgi:hypothetical protein
MTATTGRTPFGTNIYDPDAPSRYGNVELSPSMSTRKLSALIQGFGVVPPLARRAIIGALSAMGPEFAPERPENTPAKLLELMGSVGAVGPRGTPIGPLRQLIAAIVTTPQTVDMSFMEQLAAGRREHEMTSFVGQFFRDVMRRMRGQKGAERRKE